MYRQNLLFIIGFEMKLKVLIHPAEEGGYWAEVPAIAGCATQGYYLKVSNQTSISFQLIDVIDVAGQKKDIVYQFEKIN